MYSIIVVLGLNKISCDEQALLDMRFKPRAKAFAMRLTQHLGETVDRFCVGFLHSTQPGNNASMAPSL